MLACQARQKTISINFSDIITNMRNNWAKAMELCSGSQMVRLVADGGLTILKQIVI
jgi:hypothetical protein